MAGTICRSMRPHRPLRLIVLLALAVSGCATSTAPSSAPPSSAPPSGAAPSTAAASASISASPAASDSASPESGSTAAAASASPAAIDLTALLPADVGGHKLTKSQFGGADFASSGSVQPQMVDLLTSLGRSPVDMTLAIADDPSHGTDLSITAFSVRGIAVDAFLQAYLPVVRASVPEAAISQATRAGRPVYLIANLPGTGTQVLLVGTQALFVVTATDDALVDEALSKLP